MISKTKDYDMFVFRNDNREKINQAHVKRLAQSIKSRNLLELRPITVNDKMEIIDGQHRLLAAKLLGCEVFYQKENKLDPIDIIRMNVSAPWGMSDYLNYYCKHDFPEYKKLAEFMKKNSLPIKIALSIALGKAHLGFYQFRMGEFKFRDEPSEIELEICWNTINCIKKHNGFSAYTGAGKFWKGLFKIIRHPNFNKDTWYSNMQKMTSNFCQKSRAEDYVHLMQTIYNWNTLFKIYVNEENV